MHFCWGFSIKGKTYSGIYPRITVQSVWHKTHTSSSSFPIHFEFCLSLALWIGGKSSHQRKGSFIRGWMTTWMATRMMPMMMMPGVSSNGRTAEVASQLGNAERVFGVTWIRSHRRPQVLEHLLLLVLVEQHLVVSGSGTGSRGGC